MGSASGCIANIGPQERRKRLAFGIAALSVSVMIAAFCTVAGVRPVWRLPLFLPLFAGALGFFQARDKT